ncbi:Carboxypeptidase [Meloidogyne graminicola]|uniref:Carboxypeptidase n=1 Tax=Meloidogyne graminicola TaxID=189291 RepID=A0A8S9ZGL6_9BILA|nr:Carboxypeptidase [Meloidogyne graminicola]
MNKFNFLLNNLIILFLIFIKQKLTKTINNNDEITEKLPGLNFKLNFKHYSGYLQISKNKYLHYILITSKGNLNKDPLIFWFNGGPGCSSLLGLFTELGPYLLKKDGSELIENPYSWNNNASVVFIESPVGVGYSYSTDDDITNNDNQIAEENYLAIQLFFKKYPNYLKNNIFITGESYAGIYLPMLTSNIIKGINKFKINLKGLAIGNGYLNKKIDFETGLNYAYNHGVVDENIWQKFKKECCKGCIDSCDIINLTGKCYLTAINIYNIFANIQINPYDIYLNCDNPLNNFTKNIEMFTRANFRLKNMEKMAKKFALTMNMIENKRKKRDNSFDPSIVPCISDNVLQNYLNKNEVFKSLHILTNQSIVWNACSNSVGKQYIMNQDDMTPFIKTILNAKVPVLLYYGDTDSVCNFLMGQKFTEQLGYKIKTSKQPWFFNNQIGGFKTEYEGGLTFLTVRGVGHMVPQWAPARSEYILKQFINNKNI